MSPILSNGHCAHCGRLVQTSGGCDCQQGYVAVFSGPHFGKTSAQYEAELIAMTKQRDQWKACARQLAYSLRHYEAQSWVESEKAIAEFDKLNQGEQ